MKKRSDDLRNPPKPPEELNAPALDTLVDTQNPPGINLILEVCTETITDFSRQAQDDIGEVISTGPRQCLYRCAGAAFQVQA